MTLMKSLTCAFLLAAFFALPQAEAADRIPYKMDPRQYRAVIQAAEMLVGDFTSGDAGLSLVTRVNEVADCRDLSPQDAAILLVQELVYEFGMDNAELLDQLKHEIMVGLGNQKAQLCASPNSFTKVVIAQNFVLGFDYWSED